MEYSIEVIISPEHKSAYIKPKNNDWGFKSTLKCIPNIRLRQTPKLLDVRMKILIFFYIYFPENRF